jgi:hypothetical protein
MDAEEKFASSFFLLEKPSLALDSSSLDPSKTESDAPFWKTP